MAWTLDKICQHAKSAELINALHACREGHPLNKGAEYPFRNAWFMASASKSWDMPGDALIWLQKQADKRGEPTLAEIFGAR